MLSHSPQNPVENWLEQKGSESQINFGLDRIRKVADIAFRKYQSKYKKNKAKIISIGGTNGKGTTGFFLANLFKIRGIKVGWFSSPHFFQYKERIQINLKPLADGVLLKHLNNIESYRKKAGVKLSYFEYSTLCALDIFFTQEVEVIILEVGLGGRLDAVNLIDADIALITAIGLDHCEYLGNTLKAIAKEKSGILRKNQIIAIGENAYEIGLINKANKLSKQVYLLGKNLTYQINNNQLAINIQINNKTYNCNIDLNDWMVNKAMLSNLSLASCAFLASDLIKNKTNHYFDFSQLILFGRLQKFIINTNTYYVDIAHNPQAIKNILSYFKLNEKKNMLCIVAFLKDKDYQSMLKILKPWIEFYYLAPVNQDRVLKITDLSKTMQSLAINNFFSYPKLAQIIDKINQTEQKKQILIVGCFALAIESVKILTQLSYDKK